jgi:xylose isomerase
VDWEGALGRAVLSGARSLADLSVHVLEREGEPEARSGREERLENLVSRSVR